MLVLLPGMVALTACEGRGLSIQQLVRMNAEHHTHLLTVRGCYQNLREKSVFLACVDPKSTEVFRVLFRSQLENQRKYFTGFQTGPNAFEHPSLREQRLEAELSSLADGVLVDVVFRGELRIGQVE